MAFNDDWILRYIEFHTQAFARWALGKEAEAPDSFYEEGASDIGLLARRLKQLTRERRICEAEDLLFESFEESEDYLETVRDFYERLSALSDEELRANDFSREEIRQGWGDVLKRFGLDETEVEL